MVEAVSRSFTGRVAPSDSVQGAPTQAEAAAGGRDGQSASRQAGPQVSRQREVPATHGQGRAGSWIWVDYRAAFWIAMAQDNPIAGQR
jgi:hypothetical protein